MHKYAAAAGIFVAVMGIGLIGGKLANPHRDFDSALEGDDEHAEEVLFDEVTHPVLAEGEHAAAAADVSGTDGSGRDVSAADASEADASRDDVSGDDGDAADAECLAVPRRMLSYLASSLGAGVRLVDARAVRLEGFERPYAIAAELEGEGLEETGDVATWSASGLRLSDGTVVMAEDDLAAEYSTLADAREEAHDRDGAFERALSAADRCVEAEAEL
jgi:hypothetical protein